AVAQQHAKFMDPNITPSGKWLKTLLDNEIDNSVLGLELAKEYKKDVQNRAYTHFSQADFIAQALSSIKARNEIECKDDKNFTQFVNDYFGKRVSGGL
ncbi:MAG: glutamate--cysteine ligase, partial [Kangiellaceae bacterium]